MADISITLTEDEWIEVKGQLAIRSIELHDLPTFKLPGSITKETYEKLRVIINTINENLYG